MLGPVRASHMVGYFYCDQSRGVTYIPSLRKPMVTFKLEILLGLGLGLDLLCLRAAVLYV